MTVLFAGSERDAFRNNLSIGSYSESTTLLQAPYARGSSSAAVAGAWYECNFSDAVTECWLHYRRMYSGGDDSLLPPTVQFLDASDNVIARAAISTGSNYVLQYWNGSAFVNVGTTMEHVNGATYEIDINIKKDAATGRVAWYRDGVLHAEATALALTSFGDIAKVRFVGVGNTNFWNQTIITDAAQPTIGWNLWTVPPNADGTDTDGTGSYADVDELVTNTTDFIQFDNAGDKHSFLHAAIAVEDFVRGVAVAAYARRVDGTGPQSIRPYVIIGGVRYYGDTFALTTGFLSYEYIWNQSPATATDWTTAEVNDAGFQAGWEAVA